MVSPLQTLERIESRLDNLFWLPSQKGGFLPIYSSLFEDHASRCIAWDGEYRITQQSLNTIHFAAQNQAKGFKKQEMILRKKLEQEGIETSGLHLSYGQLNDAFLPQGTLIRVQRRTFPLPNNCSFL